MTQRVMGRVGALLAGVALLASVSAAWGFAHGPRWTVGRAVIVSQRRSNLSGATSLYLKLSLRNVGRPGRVPVRIFGRWAAATKRKGRAGNGFSSRLPRKPGAAWGGPSGRAVNGAAGTSGRWAIPGGSAGSRAQRTGRTGTASQWGGGSGVPSRRQTLPPGMRLLGRYNREVSLNQTAILEVPLTTLGAPRRDTTRLEVVVMTAAIVTDHQFVNLAAD